MGDVYLTDAAAVLTQYQNYNRDELYLYQGYDVKLFYPKKQCSDTFGKIIRSTLFEALNQYNNLPAVILVVTGNDEIDDKVSTPYHTKRIWTAVCTELDRAIKARKNQLPRKAFLNEEPRVFFTNVYPRYKDHCESLDKGFESFKTKRRRLNNILPQVASTFNFEVLTINGIIPDNQEFFVMSTGKLSGKGMEQFWISVSKEIRLADERVKAKIKDKIIRSYLEEEKEKDRIARERQEIRSRARFPSPGPNPRLSLDRGDHNPQKHFKQRFGNKRRGHSAHR